MGSDAKRKIPRGKGRGKNAKRAKKEQSYLYQLVSRSDKATLEKLTPPWWHFDKKDLPLARRSWIFEKTIDWKPKAGN